MKKTAVFIFITVFIGAAGFFAFQIISKERQGQLNTGLDKAAVPVTVAPVVLFEFKEEINAVGSLKAHETILLSPRVAGNVEAVPVDIGDTVKTGDIVIRLDSIKFKLAVNQATAAYETAKAGLAQSKAQFERAEKEYRRASALLAEKVIPQKRFDAAQAVYKASLEGVAAAKGQLNQAKAAMGTAKEHFNDADVRSPINGVIVDRNVEVGQSIGPGSPVFRILDQSTVKADIDLPGVDFGKITVGTDALIKVGAFPGMEFPGKVTVVNPMMDPDTRTFRVRIQAPNPAKKLVDGMFAKVSFSAGQRVSLAVPRDALQHLPGSGTFYVFVVDKNMAAKRTVKTGVTGDEYAEISDGLSAGEKVVTSGMGRLRTGTKVIIK